MARDTRIPTRRELLAAAPAAALGMPGGGPPWLDRELGALEIAAGALGPEDRAVLLRGGKPFVSPIDRLADFVRAKVVPDLRSDRVAGDEIDRLVEEGILRLRIGKTPREYGEARNGTYTEAAIGLATACAADGTPFIVDGSYRLSEPVRWGASRFNGLGFVTDATASIGDTEINGNQNAANVAANFAACRGCEIVGIGNATIVPDFEGDDDGGTPVLEYNVDNVGLPPVFSGSLAIAAPGWTDSAGFVNWNKGELKIPVNNLIGFASTSANGLVMTGMLSAVGMGKAGFVAPYPYWSDLRVLAWLCGSGARLGVMNAGQARVSAWYCDYGVVLGGDNCELRLSTEQCLTDLRYFKGSTARFYGLYNEDIDTGQGNGAGRWTLDLGEGPDTDARIVNLGLYGFRGSSVRAGKGWLNVNGCRELGLYDCRDNGGRSACDTLSNGIFYSSSIVDDQAIFPVARWRRIDSFGFDGGGGSVELVGNAGTLNKMYGRITTETLSTAPGSSALLTIVCDKVASTDAVMVTVVNSGSAAGLPFVKTSAADGAFAIEVENRHPTEAFDAPLVFAFQILKTVA